MVSNLKECGGNRSQPNDDGSEFACGISRLSSARDNLAEFVQLAQHAITVRLRLFQFGLGKLLGF